MILSLSCCPRWPRQAGVAQGDVIAAQNQGHFPKKLPMQVGLKARIYLPTSNYFILRDLQINQHIVEFVSLVSPTVVLNGSNYEKVLLVK